MHTTRTVPAAPLMTRALEAHAMRAGQSVEHRTALRPGVHDQPPPLGPLISVIWTPVATVRHCRARHMPRLVAACSCVPRGSSPPPPPLPGPGGHAAMRVGTCAHVSPANPSGLAEGRAGSSEAPAPCVPPCVCVRRASKQETSMCTLHCKTLSIQNTLLLRCYSESLEHRLQRTVRLERIPVRRSR